SPFFSSHYYSFRAMPAVDPRSSPPVNDRLEGTLSINSITALLDRSSALLAKDTFQLHRLAKLHRESVAKVATEVANCNARLLRLESILTRQRTEIVAERSHIQRLLKTLEFQDRQKSRKLDYLKRRVNKMMNSADRDLAKQQLYLKKCSLYELDDAFFDLRHAVEHEMGTLATPSASGESVASSQGSQKSYRTPIYSTHSASNHSRASTKGLLSTWALSRHLTHLSGQSSTPIDIQKGANDLLAMIERMATILSSAVNEEPTDRTQHTNGRSLSLTHSPFPILS
ncbi:hypothetical protein PENTCL1PPCAC_23172, partial [Pristionchus entomophagus]